MNITRQSFKRKYYPFIIAVAYMQGKHTWEARNITLRDDINNNIRKTSWWTSTETNEPLEQTLVVPKALDTNLVLRLKF